MTLPCQVIIWLPLWQIRACSIRLQTESYPTKEISHPPGQTLLLIQAAKHSIPYQWGSTSFSVNTDDYDGDINTTDILFNPPAELSGKINMLDSQGEVMALASLHMGFPQCSSDREQLQALNDMLEGAKKHWASFNSDTAREVLVSGDASVGMIYDGFSAKAREERASIKYAFPTQGYVCFGWITLSS